MSSEEDIATFHEVLSLLPLECSTCFYALYNITSAFNPDQPDEARAVAKNIGETCIGWQDGVSPLESLTKEKGPLEFRKSEATIKFCPTDPTPYSVLDTENEPNS